MTNEEDLALLQNLNSGGELDLPLLPSSKHQLADRANVIEQIDPERLISNVKHTLKGEEQDDEGVWSAPKGIIPYLNDRGVHGIATFIRMVINKNLIFTTYSETALRALLLEMETEINDHLRMNARIYEIKPENYIIIVNMVIYPIEAAYNRSQNGVTMDFIGNVTKQINTNRDVMPSAYPMMPQRESFIGRTLNKINPFR